MAPIKVQLNAIIKICMTSAGSFLYVVIFAVTVGSIHYVYL